MGRGFDLSSIIENEVSYVSIPHGRHRSPSICPVYLRLSLC